MASFYIYFGFYNLLKIKETFFIFSYGGANATAIKKAVDKIFTEKYNLGDVEQYCDKMISATADGASVNFGIYKGLLTKLSEDRPWLLKIHCVNHRLELAVKDAMKDSPLFILAHRMYTTIYYLLQNSGPLSAEVKNACKALNITYYELTRFAGTRFIILVPRAYSFTNGHMNKALAKASPGPLNYSKNPQYMGIFCI